MLTKMNTIWGPNSVLDILNGTTWISNGITDANVTRIFWTRRKDPKYKRPMVNWDFISLYDFQYELRSPNNKQTFARPIANAI